MQAAVSPRFWSVTTRMRGGNENKVANHDEAADGDQKNEDLHPIGTGHDAPLWGFEGRIIHAVRRPGPHGSDHAGSGRAPPPAAPACGYKLGPRGLTSMEQQSLSYAELIAAQPEELERLALASLLDDA